MFNVVKWRHKTHHINKHTCGQIATWNNNCPQMTERQHAVKWLIHNSIAKGPGHPTLLSTKKERKTSWCNVQANSPPRLTSHRKSTTEQHVTSNYVMRNGSQTKDICWYTHIHVGWLTAGVTTHTHKWWNYVTAEWNMQMSHTDKAKTWKKSQRRVVKVQHEGKTQ